MRPRKVCVEWVDSDNPPNCRQIVANNWVEKFPGILERVVNVFVLKRLEKVGKSVKKC